MTDQQLVYWICVAGTGVLLLIVGIALILSLRKGKGGSGSYEIHPWESPWG